MKPKPTDKTPSALKIIYHETMNLHEAAAFVAYGDQVQAKSGCAAIVELLRDGCEINALVDGMSALSVLLSGRREDAAARVNFNHLRELRDLIRTSAEALIQAGANPWVGTPHTWAMDDIWNPAELLHLRAASAATLDQRGPNGETDLHVFLSRDDHNLGAQTNEYVDAMLVSQWLNAVDRNGNTPLHALWFTHVRLGMVQDFEETMILAAHLVRQGADLTIINNGGLRAIDIIFAQPHDPCDMLDSQRLSSTYKILSASRDAEVLQTSTPGASANRRWARF